MYKFIVAQLVYNNKYTLCT